MGVRSDVHKLMQVMDVFLLPSRFEGLPLVLVEAQAAGLKCFTSKDVVSDECNVTQSVRFISLDSGAKVWADNILSFKEDTEFISRDDYAYKVTQAGFDINAETDKIKKYLNE